MAGGYERIHAQDEDDAEYPGQQRLQTQRQPVPGSPPPSFHSRASSPQRRNNVDPTLADAFDDDDDDASDDEPDDRQRLVRQNSTPADNSHTPTSSASPPVMQPAESAAGRRVMGGGNATDGVFANMSARPERTAETEKEEQPPTYEQAAADAAPPYWETTILAPGMSGFDEVYVDGLPVGSAFSFIWNATISIMFPLVGFLLTYLLHSTHAAKNGSRAGLGITLIRYGFDMKSAIEDGPPTMDGPDGYAAPPDPNSHNFDASDVTEGGGSGDMAGGGWFSYALMIGGWFLLIKSVAEFLRARRHEQLVLQSPDRGLGVPIIASNEPSERVV